MQRRPQLRRRALPCPGMPNKQVARTIRADNADPVQLDGSLLREAMHDEQLVERVAQGFDCGGEPGETLSIHLECRTSKVGVYQQSLKWPISKHGGVEVELKPCFIFIQLPGGSGIEDLTTRCRNKMGCPLDLDANVGETRHDAK